MLIVGRPVTLSETEQQDPGNAGLLASQDASVALQLIQHENTFINHRLAWFITLQGLLFVALGFAWGMNNAQGLVFGFSGIGILTAVSTVFALWVGAAAIERLSKFEEQFQRPSVIGQRAEFCR
jgi:hypothetical protein